MLDRLWIRGTPARALTCLLVGLTALPVSLAATPQADPTPAPVEGLQPGVIPEGTSAEAAGVWRAMTDALRSPESRERRIDAFAIRFDLRVRRGAQSNDVEVAARFLAPDWVAFTDSVGRQVGLGPGGAWLEERDGKVVDLRGREYRQDRRNLAQTRNLARNYLALTDPGRIRLESLRRLEGVPPTLPEIRGLRPSRLDWVELVTPDFGVVALPPDDREDAVAPPPPPGGPPGPPGGGDPDVVEGPPASDDAPASETPSDPRFRVLIGCDPNDHLPTLVLIRSAELLPPEQQVEHCIHLREFQANRRARGLLLPWVLDVYERWPAVPSLARFPELPAQEIWLIEARVDDLGLTPASFVPAGLQGDAPR